MSNTWINEDFTPKGSYSVLHIFKKWILSVWQTPLRKTLYRIFCRIWDGFLSLIVTRDESHSETRNKETITGVASLEFSEEEELQSCHFGRRVHGVSFPRLGKTPAGGNHEKRDHHSSWGVLEYAEKAQLTDVPCPTTEAEGRGSAAEGQSLAARQSGNHGGDHKTEVSSITQPPDSPGLAPVRQTERQQSFCICAKVGQERWSSVSQCGHTYPRSEVLGVWTRLKRSILYLKAVLIHRVTRKVVN